MLENFPENYRKYLDILSQSGKIVFSRYLTKMHGCIIAKCRISGHIIHQILTRSQFSRTLYLGSNANMSLCILDSGAFNCIISSNRVSSSEKAFSVTPDLQIIPLTRYSSCNEDTVTLSVCSWRTSENTSECAMMKCKIYEKNNKSVNTGMITAGKLYYDWAKKKNMWVSGFPTLPSFWTSKSRP
jgi:hypothetical protein